MSVRAETSEKERFVDLLRKAEGRPTKLVFWWRDDDAETDTPQLETLLALAGQHHLPLGLAVIPKGADQSLAARLAGQAGLAVFQHGWQHRNHSPAGHKKIELGGDRPVPVVLDELQRGFARLRSLFPAQFLPVLVPPWNRIDPSVAADRRRAGLVGLSGYGQASGELHCVNTHIDIFDWRGTRGLLPADEIYANLCREAEGRLSGDGQPIGLLTHHLIHQAETWVFLEDFLELTAHHPAIEWRPLPALFELSAPR